MKSKKSWRRTSLTVAVEQVTTAYSSLMPIQSNSGRIVVSISTKMANRSLLVWKRTHPLDTRGLSIQMDATQVLCQSRGGTKHQARKWLERVVWLTSQSLPRGTVATALSGLPMLDPGCSAGRTTQIMPISLRSPYLCPETIQRQASKEL